MRPRQCFIFLLALTGVGGCPTRDKYDPRPTVRIISPAIDTTYTNGIVHIAATIEPPLDLPIVLVKDGAEWTTLAASPYEYTWDTAAAPESSYTIVAEVVLSDGVVRSAPVTVVVDRTPPTVSLTPAPGATDVALRAPIQAIFSEPVALGQPADATFSLSVVGGTTVATHATVDAQGRTATIAIDDPATIALPSALEGAIGAPIADLAGNPLTPPPGQWRWSVPDFVKLPTMSGCSNFPPLMRLPTFVVGTDLKPIIAWASNLAVAGQNYCQLQVSKYNGRGWAQLASPSADLGSAVYGVALDVDAANQPVIAWRPPAAADPGEIDVASWDGTRWNAHPAIVPDSGVHFSVVYPVLHLGPDQNPLLLWGAGTSADRYFMARRTSGGWSGDFGVLPLATETPFTGPTFDMVLDDRSNPIVSYVNPEGTGHIATWDGSAWSAAPDLAGMTEPFLSLDATHAPMVVTGGSGSFLVQHLVNGSSWQLLPTAAAVPPQARHPRIAAGPDGRPVVAWFEAQTIAVGLARWTGHRWDVRAYAFGEGRVALDEAPQLIVDRQGTAWVSWRESTGLTNLWMSNY